MTLNDDILTKDSRQREAIEEDMRYYKSQIITSP